MKKITLSGLSLGTVFALSLALGGCSVVNNIINPSNAPKPAQIPKPEIFHDSKLTAGANTVRMPEFNKTFTAEVGANLYEKIYRIEYDTYSVTTSDTNQFLRKFAINNSNIICYQKFIPKNEDTYCLLDFNNTGMFTHEVKDLSDLKTTADMDEIDTLFNPIRYTIARTHPSFNGDSFRYVSLYQGKIGNKIKISFREFNQDMSRPAFTQDVDYELDKNGEALVGFKGLRIKVFQATNTDLTYSVLHDYN